MGVLGTYFSLGKELGGIVADDVKRAVTPKAREPKQPPPRLTTLLWPRNGDTRTDRGEKEVAYRGTWYGSAGHSEGQSTYTERMVPGPPWSPDEQQRATKQARERQARQSKGRAGR